MSEMFQFKYNEDVEACYEALHIEQKKISEDRRIIYIKNNDELIDLSPCIGIYQEAVFFGVGTETVFGRIVALKGAVGIFRRILRHIRAAF